MNNALYLGLFIDPVFIVITTYTCKDSQQPYVEAFFIMYNVSRKFHNLNHSIELDSIFAGKEKIMMSQYKQFL